MDANEGTMEFDKCCKMLRSGIEAVKKSTLELKHHSVFAQDQPETRQVDEMKANIMLSYRHLEDARMRLGKAVQAFDGGVSVYDK